MKSLSIVNVKGGVGKTVSTVNIGACLQGQGKKVLIVDIDPQGNSSKYLKADVQENEKSIIDVFSGNYESLNEIIRHSEYEGLDVIPSHIKFDNYIEQSKESELSRTLLKDCLSEISNEYDYCIFDCPPSLNIITINGLVASDEVIVPIKIDEFSIDGLGYLIDSIESIRVKYNPDLMFKGCFITMDRATTVNKEIKKALAEQLSDKLLDVSIRDDVKVTESTFYQVPVVIKNKKARATQDYIRLVQEVF